MIYFTLLVHRQEEQNTEQEEQVQMIVIELSEI
jgi:hypothetical protein